MEFTKVEGEKRGEVRMFALSTCGWCKKTKALLKEIGVEFSYVDVDLLEGEEKSRAIDEMGKHNPSTSFPTLVIDGEKVIIGFREKDIREALGNG